jgi:iron complex transport system ATP-binding protein
MSDATPPLELRGVTVRYGDFTALRNFTLTVPPGSFVAVLGPNGAGKSTLVRALTGLSPLAAGSIRYGDRELTGHSAASLARLVAVVPQDVWVPFEYSVLEMVLMGRAPHVGFLGLESPADVKIARAALARLGLAEMEGRAVRTLSGGERQRVLLARALAQDAPIILLDEPTAHLDIAHQAGTLELLAELHREGRTILAVLHDLNLASLYCPRLVLLRRAELAADGTAAEVLTPARLLEVYGANVVVGTHPSFPRPVVLPAAPGSG